jgi:hypothetical protein
MRPGGEAGGRVQEVSGGEGEPAVLRVEAASMEPSGDARRLLVGYGLRGGALEAAADA